LVVVGGLDAGKSSTARVWHVDLRSGTTTRLASLPQPAHDAAGAVSGDDVLVFGGGEARTIATVQRYHAGTAAVAGALPQPRSDLVAGAVGGTIYVLGGFDGTRGLADVLATTDGTNFRTIVQLPQTVRYPAVAVVDGRIWLFGGEHDGNAVSTVQVVDPNAATARVAGQLPETLAHASAMVLDHKVLLLGGRHAGRLLDRVLRYDVSTGAASGVGTLPYPVADAGAAVVDDTAYLVGGETPAVTASAIVLRYR
jgi:N-acetylneuraminic acid mutarotase